MYNKFFNVKQFFLFSVLSVIFCFSVVHISIAYEDEINKLSATMAEKIAKAGKTKVAVVDFTDLQGNVTELGRFIAEEFSVALAGAGKGFKVVDRTHLKSIIKEHRLSSTGVIAPETAKKLGKIAGVHALVTGTLTPFGDSVRISVKILDTTTAEVIDANRGNIAKTQAIKELLTKGITTRSGLSADTKPGSARQTGTTTNIKEVKDFIFELESCQRSGKSVTCFLLVTSKKPNKKLNINGTSGSRVIDDLGNEYLASQIQFGNKRHTKSVSKVLPTDVPIKVSLNFEDISPQANGLAILEISTNNKFKVDFRDISFSK